MAAPCSPRPELHGFWALLDLGLRFSQGLQGVPAPCKGFRLLGQESGDPWQEVGGLCDFVGVRFALKTERLFALEVWVSDLPEWLGEVPHLRPDVLLHSIWQEVLQVGIEGHAKQLGLTSCAKRI